MLEKDSNMFSRFVLRPLSAVSFALWVSAGGVQLAWSDENVQPFRIDNVSYESPLIEVTPKNRVFPPRAKELWLEALARPEADLKRQAAEAFAKAHLAGMQGLSEAVPLLEATLQATDAHPNAALAAARTLIALDARDAAPTLFGHVESDGLTMTLVVEPALFEWSHAPLHDVWRKRLSAAETPRELLVIAIRGLRALNDTSSVNRLTELAIDPKRSTRVRIEAARALGHVSEQGLAETAATLIAKTSSGSLTDRIIAAEMLGSHWGEAAQQVLSTLAADKEPVVAAIALGTLRKIDAELALPFAEQALSHSDAKLRQQAARVYAKVPNPDRVRVLSTLLDDRSPRVRTYARDALFELAAFEEYGTLVRELAMQILSANQGRAQEQASLLLGELDHKPAAMSLVPLLEHKRLETAIAAAWAVKKLAVQEALPGMLRAAEHQTAKLRGTPSMPGRRQLDQEMSQLCQAFGAMKYEPADEFLRKYVPRGKLFRTESRATAIWALGLLHVDDPEPELVEALIARLKDVESTVPEEPRVRRMSAISLGRMKATSAVRQLERFYGEGVHTLRDVGYTCAWALRRITGEDVPNPRTPDEVQRGWFLEPLDETDGDQ